MVLTLSQVLLEDETCYAEILYFFRVKTQSKEYILAAASLYSKPDEFLWNFSQKTLVVCDYLGDEDIVIFEAKNISDVIAMVPFKRQGHHAAETDVRSSLLSRK